MIIKNCMKSCSLTASAGLSTNGKHNEKIEILRTVCFLNHTVQRIFAYIFLLLLI